MKFHHVSNKSPSLKEKYHLNDSTWTYKGFHGVLHTFFAVAQAVSLVKDLFGYEAKGSLFFVADDYVHWYWRDEDLIRIREIFLERMRENKNYLKELEKEWHTKIDLFERIIAKVNATSFSLLSKDDPASLYDRFYERYVDQFRYFMILGDAISMHADRYLVPEFEKVLGSNFAAVFPELLTTRYTSFVEEESIARAKLLRTLRDTGAVDQATLKDHANRFFYIHNNYAKGIRLEADDFRKMLQDDLQKRTEPSKNDRDGRTSEQQRLIEKYKLSPWHQTLLHITDEFFKIQDTRKKYVLIANYYQFQFLKEAERRGGIPFKLLHYSIYPEFRDALEGTLNTQLLEERRKLCAFIQTTGSYEIVYGTAAEDAFAFFWQGGQSQTEIKGMVASRGKAQGRVKKILKIHDMANMKKGNILVSSMTRPEMVPAMKLAAAIVTDEGGVTSHAAIVSREMKIPCIIGTKIATQVLKDGDMVEVDADKGVVRILK